MDASAQFGQAGDFEVFVFEVEGLVGAVFLGGGEHVLQRIRIKNLVFEFLEFGVNVLAPGVGGDGELAFPAAGLGVGGG